MKKLLFIIGLFICFQSFGQNRFPSVDSAKAYTLRYIRNSTVESFTNLRMQNVAYGTLELLDSITNSVFGAGVDSIWLSSSATKDTIKYSISGYTYTAATLDKASLRVAISDSAAMLSGYVRVQRFLDSLSAHTTRLNAVYDSLNNHVTRADTTRNGIRNDLNGKQGALTLTTTGSSGASTLVGNTLNIPQYSGGGAGDSSFVKLTSDTVQIGTILPQVTTDSIVAIGTSITSGSGASQSSYSFASRVAAGLRLTLWNRGISGEILQKPTGFPLANSFMDHYSTTIPTKTENLKYLMFEWGVNDVYYDIAVPSYNLDTSYFKFAYKTIVNDAVSKGWSISDIIINSITIQPTYYDTTFLYYTATRNFCDSAGIRFIDQLSSQLIDSISILYDQVHPNDYGHAKMANNILANMKTVNHVENTGQQLAVDGIAEFSQIYARGLDTLPELGNLAGFDVNGKAGLMPLGRFVKIWPKRPSTNSVLTPGSVYLKGEIEATTINSTLGVRAQGFTSYANTAQGVEMYYLNGGVIYSHNSSAVLTPLYLKASAVGVGGGTIRTGFGSSFTFDAGGNIVANGLTLSNVPVQITTSTPSLLMGMSTTGLIYARDNSVFYPVAINSGTTTLPVLINTATDNGIDGLQVNGTVFGNRAQFGTSSTAVGVRDRMLYVNGSVGANKDSIPLAAAGTSYQNVLIDTSTGKFYRASILTGSATLDFGSTAAATSTDLTITVTGAADGDVVSLGVPNAAVSANSAYTAWVSASNTVTVRFHNYQTVGAIDPTSATFKVRVIK